MFDKYLTHYRSVLLFYIPSKHQETFRFPDVFRGYRKATPGCNGLNKPGLQVILNLFQYLNEPQQNRPPLLLKYQKIPNTFFKK